MKPLPLVARVLLGVILVVFGVISALAPETDMGEDADAFVVALKDTGYLWPLVKATEITSGLLLLTGLFIPLALVLLAPVALNILLFHAFLSPSPGGLTVAALVLTLGVYLAHHHRSNFSDMLERRVRSG
ncbi:MAG: DoxX family membrane protein [Holophagales bacterium]|nr:DoxX family membrane protein [Holophagales bacterium]MYG29481.1 DoxX family membrane protein [Holophagales bacterium]MYI80001.1 DoxX family membrane protein [Holophagales bacterium]